MMKLHEQRDIYKHLYSEAKTGLIEIRRYLNSNKFNNDINVNKNDILMRLNEIDNDLFVSEIQLND